MRVSQKTFGEPNGRGTWCGVFGMGPTDPHQVPLSFNSQMGFRPPLSAYQYNTYLKTHKRIQN